MARVTIPCKEAPTLVYRSISNNNSLRLYNMNKYICILLLASASLLSCKKNFLDKGPDEDLTIEKAFTDKLNTERFLTSVYAYLPREWFFADLTEASPFIGA